jgi:hypothetical protein
MTGFGMIDSMEKSSDGESELENGLIEEISDKVPVSVHTVACGEVGEVDDLSGVVTTLPAWIR